jgi:pyruvate,water dikinase
MLGIVHKLKNTFFRKKVDQRMAEIIFRSIFSRFRDLLDANNRALELIADMGDKLSGDYIFDKVYIINTYQELADKVYKAIYNLNMIAANKYMQLYDVFESLYPELKAYLEGRTGVFGEKFIFNLKDLDKSLGNVVGNKAAPLGEIRNRAQLNTPDGFAITTIGYKHFLEQNGLLEKIESLLRFWEKQGEESTEKISKEIQSLFKAAEVPSDLKKAIEKAVVGFNRHRRNAFFAVRSSTVEEDSDHSFAGQFETILNVPGEAIIEAYKEVIASVFSPSALIYAQKRGYLPQQILMGVLCLEMVPTKVSGVIYTIDPNDLKAEAALINANWGLGKTVVDGSASLDRYKVLKTPPYKIIEQNVSAKKKMLVSRPQGGVEEVLAPSQGCLTEEQINKLMEVSLAIERYFKQPQDIEWSFDNQDNLYILQARSLRRLAQREETHIDLSFLRDKYHVILAKRGVVAERGIGAGPVYQVQTDEDLIKFPQGAVLVARRTSPRLGRVMHKVSAIVTDIGSPTGHIASLARESRVPTIVDAGVATQVLKPGMNITVDAGENIVYEGIVKELLNFYLLKEPIFEDSYEYRLLRRILNKVAPLNLTNPESADFRPEKCKTFHDIIRFAHEKAVAELIDFHMDKTVWRGVPAKKLKTKIPLDLVIIDLGGGLVAAAQEKTEIEPKEIKSLPMSALWEGLSAPGVWRTEPMPIDFRAMMSSMTRTSQALNSPPRYSGYNLVVVSREYINLSLRLGYHFNMVDAYLSDNMLDNYIYFRFLGGVTDINRRTRRAQLLAQILEKYDFRVDIKGDLVVSRIREVSKLDMQERLKMIGRLIGFTRQLDVMMHSDKAVEHHVKIFLKGNYQNQ